MKILLVVMICNCYKTHDRYQVSVWTVSLDYNCSAKTLWYPKYSIPTHWQIISKRQSHLSYKLWLFSEELTIFWLETCCTWSNVTYHIAITGFVNISALCVWWGLFHGASWCNGHSYTVSQQLRAARPPSEPVGHQAGQQQHCSVHLGTGAGTSETRPPPFTPSCVQAPAEMAMGLGRRGIRMLIFSGFYNSTNNSKNMANGRWV